MGGRGTFIGATRSSISRMRSNVYDTQVFRSGAAGEGEDRGMRDTPRIRAMVIS